MGDIIYALFVIGMISIFAMCIVSIAVSYCMKRDCLFSEQILDVLFRLCRVLEFIVSLVVLVLFVYGIYKLVLFILDSIANLVTG